MFKKIEPYLTFLNITQLNRQGADLQTKIEELHDINQLLRNKQNEREEQIRGMQDQIHTIMNTLVDIKNKERKYNREFELEFNPITKDEKFESSP